MSSSKRIIIDDLIGKRYKPNGRGPLFYDCYGLVIEVSKRLGHELLDVVYNKWTPDFFQGKTNEVAAETAVYEVPFCSEMGDILLFKNGVGIFHHIGVYLDSDCFIHCNKLGVRIDKLEDFKQELGRVYRWR